MNAVKSQIGTAGTTTAGLVIGGLQPPDNNTAITETWDGTSWTEVNDLNTARDNLQVQEHKLPH